MDNRLDPDILNNSGETALQIARRTGMSRVFFEMIKAGYRSGLPTVVTCSEVPESDEKRVADN